MKTIYNAKALCVVALLGTATVAGAQEDTSKEKNLNREMTLEREYDPTVQDASKVNTLPVVKEPEVKKMAIDYANFTVPADPAKEISLMPSGNIMTQMNYNKRRGYFNFGAGTYLNLNGDFGYHILSTEKDKLNVFLSHRSTNGKVKYIQMDEKVKAKLNDNLGGINFKHEFEKAALTLGAKYGYTAFNYYGMPLVNPVLSTVPAEADRETNQVNQVIRVNAGMESREGASFGYLLDVDYTNFSHKYGLHKEIDGITEHTVGVKFDLNAAFGGNQKIGLGGKLDYFNYSSIAEDPTNTGGSTGLPRYVVEFENHAEATLSPYYNLIGDNWHVKLGVNAMIITGSNSKFFVSPNVTADIEVADKTVLYGIATGDMRSNSAYELSLENRYVNPSMEALPTRTWLDATVGIKSGVLPNFWFDVFGGYKMMDNAAFFVPIDRDYYSGDFANVSSVFQADVNLFHAGVNLKYSYQQLLDISLKGVYNVWGDIDKYVLTDIYPRTYAPYGKPKAEITAGIDIKPVDKLSLLLNYYLATGRETLLFRQDVAMKNINELNLTGTYNMNDTFGVYVKLNNLLFQKYEVIYGYPLQSFSAMVGVNLNF